MKTSVRDLRRLHVQLSLYRLDAVTFVCIDTFATILFLLSALK